MTEWDSFIEFHLGSHSGSAEMPADAIALLFKRSTKASYRRFRQVM
jgi:hypothetical protein